MKKLKLTIRGLSDNDLIRAIACPSDYTTEAFELYKAEIRNRTIDSELLKVVVAKEEQSKKDKQAVTLSFKGIGERFYGKRQFRLDGSYLSTKWFVFMYVPIYPILSLRLVKDNEGKIRVTEILPICWKQVIDTYVFLGLSWSLIAILARLIEQYLPSLSNVMTIGLL